MTVLVLQELRGGPEPRPLVLQSRDASPAVLRVEVAGGGPTGLALGCMLRESMGDHVHVRIHDRRWTTAGGRVVWRGGKDGIGRRRQVVTLQSNVWGAFHQRLRDALFVEGAYSEMWPLGPDSPEMSGRPRNMRIRWFEDCLLDLAQDAYGIELIAGKYVVPERWDHADVLAICDGHQSQTRQALSCLGTPSREFFSLDNTPYEETVIGLEVNSDLPDEYTVPLTVCQNRFLFNSHQQGGFINMRLSPEEAAEVVGIDEHGPVDCIQRHPCIMRPRSGGFGCETHRALFKPSVDQHSFLWPRIQDGLRLFGVAPKNLTGVTMFKLGMSQYPRFTAELSPGKFAFLLGDAACALHFWPGRGLNSGLKTVQSLARCLKSQWSGRGLRPADFTRHEALMHALQYREKGRAWTAMTMPEDDGNPRLITDRIRDGLKPPFHREDLKRELLSRIQAIKSRLTGRMGSLPADDWYVQRLFGLEDSTLKVMVETGPWATKSVGGEEVSVDSFS